MPPRRLDSSKYCQSRLLCRSYLHFLDADATEYGVGWVDDRFCQELLTHFEGERNTYDLDCHAQSIRFQVGLYIIHLKSRINLLEDGRLAVFEAHLVYTKHLWQGYYRISNIGVVDCGGSCAACEEGFETSIEHTIGNSIGN